MQIGSRGFQCKGAESSSVIMVILKTKSEGGTIDRSRNLCWGALQLCETVATAGYILTYNVTPVEPEAIITVSTSAINTG